MFIKGYSSVLREIKLTQLNFRVDVKLKIKYYTTTPTTTTLTHPNRQLPSSINWNFYRK